MYRRNFFKGNTAVVEDEHLLNHERFAKVGVGIVMLVVASWAYYLQVHQTG